MRVMIRGIKIRIVADASRELHGHISLRVEDDAAQGGIVAQIGRVGREQMLKDFTRLAPNGATESEKSI